MSESVFVLLFFPSLKAESYDLEESLVQYNETAQNNARSTGGQPQFPPVLSRQGKERGDERNCQKSSTRLTDQRKYEF